MAAVMPERPTDTWEAVLADPATFPTRSFRAMGCGMSLTLATAHEATAQAAFDAARAQIETYEAVLSRFRPESELSRLNAVAGRWAVATPVLATVLRAALRAARLSKGLCTPTLLDALEAAGYDRDFAELGRTPAVAPSRPSPRERGRGWGRPGAPRHVAGRRPRSSRLDRARRHSWRSILLGRSSAAGVRVRFPWGVRLDLAGVAKGWTADRVADALAEIAPCLVDAGGDLAARGAPLPDGGWPVAIADPHRPDANLAIVLLRDAGIATSGVDVRHWQQNGRRRHHLIDPRSGRPATTDLLTATVIAPTTVDADVHAKVALLLGGRGGLAYLMRRNLAGLLVWRDGRHLTTPRWSDYVLAD